LFEIAGYNRIFLIGSSNATEIIRGPIIQDGIGRENEYDVMCITQGGLSINKHSEKSYLRHIPSPSEDVRLIIVVGSNEYENHEYDSFKTNYVRSLMHLFKLGFHNHQIFAILPMIRGKEISLHEEQIKRMKELHFGLKFLGIASKCWHDLLPADFKSKRKIFGKNDLKKGQYVHYSPKARECLSEFLEKELIPKFDDIRKESLM
jgi:hypothetical protein